METITYHTDRLFASIITILFMALIFMIDIDVLLKFYEDIELTILIVAAGLIMPAIAFFGFQFTLLKGQIIYKHYLFLKKDFKISDLSHILYQPTWSGVMSMDSKTNMRSLHIVRRSGGWRDTISLANGAFREEDLADIAKRLKEINPKVITDEFTETLIKKYEKS
uniref:DUF304 domain-containing protein n=2 Tax=Candidatus Giovannoniibacteriota TaxID=1752738 RepID=A0A0G0ZGV9_9BACT|nr:MAG: hypothetical protein UV11_C0012G0004 [Candidatus Giovannonibacteria bacterium GW2011_GWF2_42_19]